MPRPEGSYQLQHAASSSRELHFTMYIMTYYLSLQGEQGEDGKMEGAPGPPGDRVRLITIIIEGHIHSYCQLFL